MQTSLACPAAGGEPCRQVAIKKLRFGIRIEKDGEVDKQQFVPKDFAIPAGLETEQFRLRMLCVEDVNKDYEAVMETQGRFLSMGYDWPRVGFTIEENLADLEQHQQEFLS